MYVEREMQLTGERERYEEREKRNAEGGILTVRKEIGNGKIEREKGNSSAGKEAKRDVKEGILKRRERWREKYREKIWAGKKNK